MKKILMILICAVAVGLLSMTVSAKEEENAIYTDNKQVEGEPLLIAPNPDVMGDESKKSDEDPVLISPLSGGDKPSVNAGVAEMDGKDFVKTAGIPTLAMICVIASTTIAVFVLYKKK